MDRLWATKSSNDEWWSSFVTAPLAVLLNYIVVDVAWLTPNLLTLASFICALVAAGFVVAGGLANFIIAAALIHLSHILDCMDGQMARYRRTTTASGSYYDRATDQIQVGVWFGACGYAAFDQTGDVLPAFLSLIGLGFYSLRGYTKYIAIHVEMSRDSAYLGTINAAALAPAPARREWTPARGIRWFVGEQRKILRFDEGVFIFMLSLALIVDQLTAMLWVFAVSQAVIGSWRTWQHGRNIELNQKRRADK